MTFPLGLVFQYERYLFEPHMEIISCLNDVFSKFRVVPVDQFLQHFASDRSHMVCVCNSPYIIAELFEAGENFRITSIFVSPATL
jgi:sulfur relay (sulfurtransferase) DsrC/TusE family protein